MIGGIDRLQHLPFNQSLGRQGYSTFNRSDFPRPAVFGLREGSEPPGADVVQKTVA
ncbi:hypothetical protein [Brevundimonas intermedia]|uniref:hypothetical protein n=1 Tax=Brevundimonas intermedia TaxID=74315 RepID=UPI00142FF3A1|nr:hypothetical protein [Brevundimonas intermedia]